MVDPLQEWFDKVGHDINVPGLCCNVSLRQYYKVIIIPTATSRHHPDMASSVLNVTLNWIQRSMLAQHYIPNVMQMYSDKGRTCTFS